MERKDEIIKFRVSMQDKKTLKQLADSNNESLSSYILRKSLYEASNLSNLLPLMVDTTNFFKEIFHKIQKNGNRQLISDVLQLYQNHINHTTEVQR